MVRKERMVLVSLFLQSDFGGYDHFQGQTPAEQGIFPS